MAEQLKEKSERLSAIRAEAVSIRESLKAERKRLIPIWWDCKLDKCWELERYYRQQILFIDDILFSTNTL